MATKQNYENYHKAYYHKNKDRIRERTREYRRNYNKLYYLENREKILAKRKVDKEKGPYSEPPSGL